MLLRAYLIVFAWVLAGSAVAQFFLTRGVAAGSSWGYAPGWQREIAFFNLGMLMLVARALRTNDLPFQRTMAIVLATLSALVATNHLFAARAEAAITWVHTFGIATNYASVAFAIIALVLRPPWGVGGQSPRLMKAGR